MDTFPLRATEKTLSFLMSNYSALDIHRVTGLLQDSRIWQNNLLHIGLHLLTTTVLTQKQCNSQFVNGLDVYSNIFLCVYSHFLTCNQVIHTLIHTSCLILTFFCRTLIFLSLTSNMSFMSLISPARVPFSSVRSCSCLVFLFRKDSFSSKRRRRASTWSTITTNQKHPKTC